MIETCHSCGSLDVEKRVEFIIRDTGSYATHMDAIAANLQSVLVGGATHSFVLCPSCANELEKLILKFMDPPEDHEPIMEIIDGDFE